jgi:hypothetical protein
MKVWLLYRLDETAELERDKALLLHYRQHSTGKQPYRLLETRGILIGLDQPVLKNRAISLVNANRLLLGEPMLPAPTVWERLRKAAGLPDVPPHDHYGRRHRVLVEAEYEVPSGSSIILDFKEADNISELPGV